MNLALWIAQPLLAIFFGVIGFLKLTRPKDELAPRMTWVEDVEPSTVKLIGGLELAGAAGLILPPVTGILPWLAPLAAVGLVLTMVGAMAAHARRREYRPLAFNLVLLLLAAFVAYGRFVVAPA